VEPEVLGPPDEEQREAVAGRVKEHQDRRLALAGGRLCLGRGRREGAAQPIDQLPVHQPTMRRWL
jgi:hypothetical protein